MAAKVPGADAVATAVFCAGDSDLLQVPDINTANNNTQRINTPIAAPFEPVLAQRNFFAQPLTNVLVRIGYNVVSTISNGSKTLNVSRPAIQLLSQTVLTLVCSFQRGPTSHAPLYAHATARILFRFLFGDPNAEV